jgi:hypothetical protein
MPQPPSARVRPAGDQGGGEALRAPEVVVVVLSRLEGGSHCVAEADTTSDKPAFRRAPVATCAHTMGTLGNGIQIWDTRSGRLTQEATDRAFTASWALRMRDDGSVFAVSVSSHSQLD